MALDVQGLILLLLFIAPGFLFARGYLGAAPRYHQTPSAFEQTVLAVVASSAIHSLLLSLLLAVPALLLYLGTVIASRSLSIIPSIDEVAQLSANIFDASPRMVTGWLFFGSAYVGVSLIIAYKLGRWLPSSRRCWHWLRELISDRIPEVMLWYSSLVEEPLRQGNEVPRVVASLRNGELIEGDLVRLKLVSDSANVIDFALENTVFVKTVGMERSTSLRNCHILLRSSDVLWMARVDHREG